MEMNQSEHIGNVLIAAVLTIVLGLLAASLMWGSIHFVSTAATTATSTAE